VLLLLLLLLPLLPLQQLSASNRLPLAFLLVGDRGRWTMNLSLDLLLMLLLRLPRLLLP
jgi:hypothetical protein